MTTAEVKAAIRGLTRAERFSLAQDIVSEIDGEWMNADDAQKWEAENVASYGSSMSFDELAAEVRAVVFK